MSRRCSRCTTAHTGSSPGAPATSRSRWAPARIPSPSAGLSLARTRQRRPPSLAAAAGRPTSPSGSPSRPRRPQRPRPPQRRRLPFPEPFSPLEGGFLHARDRPRRLGRRPRAATHHGRGHRRLSSPLLKPRDLQPRDLGGALWRRHFRQPPRGPNRFITYMCVLYCLTPRGKILVMSTIPYLCIQINQCSFSCCLVIIYLHLYIFVCI
ncbi:MAG: hypothetical protein AN484_25330 [Aphanizomenon flos-aquae WA102]|uniref:Uncharacterized protein n=1 Tax=Aphanizomenon flos-aquae WA102 TaxID=1710896 RepID=A0A1B7WIL3_APHFL|nr:MAG: hypothetical protein AN484_25330 [Aphanizomenon flos-aquae WA102]